MAFAANLRPTESVAAGRALGGVVTADCSLFSEFANPSASGEPLALG